MKKILFLFALIGALFASCSENEINDPNVIANDDGAITFRTLRDKTVTRYANDNKSNYMVYAQVKGATGWLIDGLTVDVVNGTYTSNYYWPGGGTEVSFYSFAPASSDSVTVSKAEAGTSPAIDLSFTVPTSGKTDFTIATPQTLNKAGTTDGIVPLQFNHALSKVYITAALSTELVASGYKLTDGFKATFSVPNSSGTISAVTSVTTTSGTSSISDNAWTMATPANVGTYSNDTVYYFLPQVYTPCTNNWNTDASQTTVSGNCYVELTNLQITNNGAIIFPDQTATEATETGSLRKYYLTSTNITSSTFLPGKQYNFVITITDLATDSDGKPVFNGKISFSSTVSDWSVVTVPITQPSGTTTTTD